MFSSRKTDLQIKSKLTKQYQVFISFIYPTLLSHSCYHMTYNMQSSLYYAPVSVTLKGMEDGQTLEVLTQENNCVRFPIVGCQNPIPSPGFMSTFVKI